MRLLRQRRGDPGKVLHESRPRQERGRHRHDQQAQGDRSPAPLGEECEAGIGLDDRREAAGNPAADQQPEDEHLGVTELDGLE